MAGWWSSSNAFDEQIARATSESLPTGTEDMFLSLEIADQIRSKSVAPKDAMRALKRRINHKNPNVQLATLTLTDTCVKNGGDHFLMEIASREFMDNLVSILKSPTANRDVHAKMLEEIQVWALAFEGRPHLSYVKTVYNKLKSVGFQFPEPVAVSASFVDSSAPPEWADSDQCTRCHNYFTLTNRKHHCRNCGNVFCGDCSSKKMPLPRLGIVEPVRVCETCYDELNAPKTVKPSSNTNVPSGLQSSRSLQPRNARIEDDDDRDLKMALQMSLEEARRTGIGPSQLPQQEPPQPITQNNRLPDEAEDQDLKAAIAASLKDMEAMKGMQYPSVQPPQSTGQQPVPESAPIENTYSTQPLVAPTINTSNELSPLEAENITLFATLIDRMKASPPGAILREPRIQELYEAVSALKPKLGRTLSSVVGTYETLVDMHAKLNTVVRYYDKMLEDRLQTTYSQATYQEARRPAQSPLPYQYNLPPQSPSSPSHPSQGYFPSRRSTFSDQVNAPPASVTGFSSTYYGPSQPPSQYPSNPTSTNGTNAPPSKAPYIPHYSESAGYQYSHPAAGTSRPSISDIPPSSPQQSRQRRGPEYPAYSEQESYYQAPPQRREDSSLIDL